MMHSEILHLGHIKNIRPDICGDWSYTKSENMETPLMNVKGLYVLVRIQSSNKTI
jgi:hypothetical protein